MRGNIELRESTLFITLGEIKSSKGLKEALKQLIKRLTIIGYAATVIADSVKVTLSLHGKVYTRRGEWLKGSPDIATATAEEDIEESTSYPITIRITRI